jgi:hypothetical protein
LRFCNSCSAQFPDSVSRCVHCGGRLQAELARKRRPDAPEQLVKGMHFLARRQPAKARRLLEALQDAGVNFVPVGKGGSRQVDVRYGSSGYYASIEIYVDPDDFERASEIEQRVLRETLPEPPGGFRPPSRTSDVCPACDTPLSPDASQCPECGLFFPE